VWSLGGLLASYMLSSLLHRPVAGLSDLSSMKINIKMYIGLLEEPPTNDKLETKLKWMQVLVAAAASAAMPGRVGMRACTSGCVHPG